MAEIIPIAEYFRKYLQNRETAAIDYPAFTAYVKGLMTGKDAALLVRDAEAAEKLMPTALELVHDPERIAVLERNAAAMALPDAAQTIVDEIYKLLDK